MNLKQQLIAETMKDAGAKIATIDANAGLIAETESLSAALCAALPAGHYTGTPVITVHRDSITARVQCHGLPRHEIIAAIARAGLRVTGESACGWEPQTTMLHIEGFDVPIHDNTPANIIAEAA